MIVGEGKTKRIISTERPSEVIIETKDDLTAGDAAKRETISGISALKTRQACNVFELLNRRDIATAFIRRSGDRALLCHECEMLPLELVMRRFAWGSYLKRNPDIVSTQEKPHRFESVKVEMFHKHAVVTPPLVQYALQMEEGKARELYLRNGVWAEGVYTDPLIRAEEKRWRLYSAKKPVESGKPLLDTPPLLSSAELKHLIHGIMIPVFETIEKAWAGIETGDGPVALVDIKIEAGRRKNDGKLVVADVIDNDSWRIWPGANPGKQLDKQCFRDGHPLSEVAEKYELVAELTDRFLK